MQSWSEKLKRVYTVPEVARILACSEGQVYNLFRRGLLPAVRLGRQLRVDREVLDEFIKTGGRRE